MRRRTFQLLALPVLLIAVVAFIGALSDIPALAIGAGFIAGVGGVSLGFYVQRHPVR